MTPLTTPLGGRGARSSLRWPESACSVSASRGAIKPREGPAGLGGHPLLSPGRRRGLGVFQGRRKLLVRGPAPPPSPSWSNLGIFYPQGGHG